MKKQQIIEVKLQKIVGGGQALGQLEDGRKIFVWGGLPGELVKVQITKKKSKFCEGVVTEVLEPSSARILPKDIDSYLSTSPWQIIDFSSEIDLKEQLIKEAFELSGVDLEDDVELFSGSQQYDYRNKIEFSWWWDNDLNQLDLAFFRRGSHGKIPVNGTSLAKSEINQAATKIRDLLRAKSIDAFSLKTLLMRANRSGEVIAQLYVKQTDFPPIGDNEFKPLNIRGLEVIYSNPKSPASVITEKLQKFGENTLTDDLLGTTFSYTADSFFQINLPVYEQALLDIREHIPENKEILDLYSGVGTIGLNVGSKVTLVESNEKAVGEMQKNIETLGRSDEAQAILSTSEKALEYISSDKITIVDPPRAGLHKDVVDKLLSEKPPLIIYLSCNPVTQARDAASLLECYKIIHQKGYNFFPRTPHIENLIVLKLT